MGLPVPPGFTISTEVCAHFTRHGGRYPPNLEDEVRAALEKIEREVGKRFGDPENPLLVSVRSGARVSMPGMMDTVLNLGLNDDSVQGLATKTENERFAWDSYRRFVQMFGNVARGMPGEAFQDAIKEAKQERGVETDTDLDTDDLKALTEKFKEAYKEHTGDDFPQDPLEQLKLSIRAVFDSWTGERAVSYRRLNRIPDDWGTAVNVQQMVFGNKGDDSGSGVAFSRRPSAAR
jgi:pyruvate,orthophosphate dikinase